MKKKSEDSHYVSPIHTTTFEANAAQTNRDVKVFKKKRNLNIVNLATGVLTMKSRRTVSPVVIHSIAAINDCVLLCVCVFVYLLFFQLFRHKPDIF